MYLIFVIFNIGIIPIFVILTKGFFSIFSDPSNIQIIGKIKSSYFDYCSWIGADFDPKSSL